MIAHKSGMTMRHLETLLCLAQVARSERSPEDIGEAAFLPLTFNYLEREGLVQRIAADDAHKNGGIIVHFFGPFTEPLSGYCITLKGLALVEKIETATRGLKNGASK